MSVVHGYLYISAFCARHAGKLEKARSTLTLSRVAAALIPSAHSDAHKNFVSESDVDIAVSSLKS